MSYTSTRRGRPLREQPMGDIWDVINAANVGVEIARDPALPELIAIAGQISEARRARGIQPSAEPGMGLADVVPLAKAFLEYQRNPWILPLAVAAILGIPFLVGYSMRK